MGRKRTPMSEGKKNIISMLFYSLPRFIYPINPIAFVFAVCSRID